MGGRGDWLGWRGCGREGGLARLERVWEGEATSLQRYTKHSMITLEYASNG